MGQQLSEAKRTELQARREQLQRELRSIEDELRSDEREPAMTAGDDPLGGYGEGFRTTNFDPATGTLTIAVDKSLSHDSALALKMVEIMQKLSGINRIEVDFS